MTDSIHNYVLAKLQMLETQVDIAHMFLDSKNVSRCDEAKKPYTLAERISKMVGDLPARPIPFDESQEVVEEFRLPVPPTMADRYAGFNFVTDEHA